MIANVAIDRFESVIDVSRSILQAIAATEYCFATFERKRMTSGP